jgi:hypothetical protein
LRSWSIAPTSSVLVLFITTATPPSIPSSEA